MATQPVLGVNDHPAVNFLSQPAALPPPMPCNRDLFRIKAMCPVQFGSPEKLDCLVAAVLKKHGKEP